MKRKKELLDKLGKAIDDLAKSSEGDCREKAIKCDRILRKLRGETPTAYEFTVERIRTVTERAKVTMHGFDRTDAHLSLCKLLDRIDEGDDVAQAEADRWKWVCHDVDDYCAYEILHEETVDPEDDEDEELEDHIPSDDDNDD